jgi:outer membrane receptor protein involved in Fe transport
MLSLLRLRQRATLACGVLFVSFPVCKAGAQTTERAPDTTATRMDSARTTTLGPVVVSASRDGTALSRMPLHVSVVTQAEIRKAPAQTLDQVLREVPGMNLPGAPYYTTDPTGQQTKMRGVSNSKVLMLVDGIPVHDPFYATTQWFKVPVSAVERVEIVRGGNSSLWGNLAVAGVVNIITKKPVDNGGELGVSYQSMNTTNVALAKNFVATNGLSLRVSGDLLDTDGYQTTPKAFLNTVPGKSASSARNGNAEAALYYSPGGETSGFIRGGFHQQNELIGGYKFGTNLQKSTDAAAGLTRFFSEDTRADLRAWGQRESFDKSNGAACYLASATSCNTSATTSPLVQYINSHDDNPYRELGASAIVSTVRRSGILSSVQAGADFRMVSGDDDAITYNRPTTSDISSSTINRTNIGKGRQNFLGAFTQLRVSPLSRFEATLSARYDYWTNSAGIAEMVKYANGIAGTKFGGTVPDSHRASFNPTLSARLDVNHNLALRGAGYRSFRAPGLNNLYRSFSSTTSITIANPNLKPETLTGGEIGADLTVQTVTLGATFFQYNTSSLIASYKIANATAAPSTVIAICGANLSNCPTTVNFNTNGQDARSRGLELVAGWRPSRRVDVNGTFTNTDSRYISAVTGDPINSQLGGIPRIVETLGLTAELTSRWSAYTSLRHTGKMFLDVNHTIGQRAFSLFNVSTSYRLSDHFEVNAAGNNLTNERYSDAATTSAASQTLGMPRTFTSGVRVRF